MPKLGPYSRAATLAKLDRRTREARLLAAMRRDLAEHVGGNPTLAQQVLIDRCAWLAWHVAALDAKAASEGTLSERDARQYLAWNNTLTRLVRQLGPAKAATSPARTLAQKLAERAASQP